MDAVDHGVIIPEQFDEALQIAVVLIVEVGGVENVLETIVLSFARHGKDAAYGVLYHLRRHLSCKDVFTAFAPRPHDDQVGSIRLGDVLDLLLGHAAGEGVHNADVGNVFMLKLLSEARHQLFHVSFGIFTNLDEHFLVVQLAGMDAVRDAAVVYDHKVEIGMKQPKLAACGLDDLEGKVAYGGRMF